MKSGRSHSDFPDDDHYHDDPVTQHSPRTSRSKVAALAMAVLAGGLYLNGTLAANITLRSGNPIEYGQAANLAVACSGASDIAVIPQSTFVNAANGTGTHYLKSITVSNIPAECYGEDFNLSVFNSSGNTPISLAGNSTTSVAVYNDNGSFRLSPMAPATISSGSGSFVLTFPSPIATSTSAVKFTIQSGVHVPFCDENSGSCLGKKGPGGGTVFYQAATPFSCGPTLNLTCKFLEYAPKTWYASDGYGQWQSQGGSINIPGLPDVGSATYTASDLGLGYQNSLAIISALSSDTGAAAFKARSYSGGGFTDWYLPTLSELNLMCQWNRGVTLDVTTACAGGIFPSTDFDSGQKWWTSTEKDANTVWMINFGNSPNPAVVAEQKGNQGNHRTRAIRAF
jgi:hypothetical protein